MVLHRLVAPQIADRHDQVPAEVRVGASARLAFGGDGNARHRLDDGVLVGAVLGRPRGPALVGHQGP